MRSAESTSDATRSATESDFEAGMGELLFYDPLLARIESVGQLPPADRLNWICSAKSTFARRKAELLVSASDNSYLGVAAGGAAAVIDVQMATLDRLYDAVLRELGSGYEPSHSSLP